MPVFRKFICTCLVLVLPVGFYPDDSDSTNVWFRLGGGTGQYSTVIQSCDEPPLIHSDSYTDLGADLSFRPFPEDPVFVGVRGGHLSAGIRPNEDYGNSIGNGYVNPYMSIETKYFGIGAGWMRNIGPVLKDKLSYYVLGRLLDLDSGFDYRNSKNLSSGHLRIGSPRSIYFFTSFNEGVPIVSQYGYFLFGMGYGKVEGWQFLTGLSGGFYDQAGFYLGMTRDMGKNGWPQLSIRLGSSEDEFEGGVSLNWAIPIN